MIACDMFEKDSQQYNVNVDIEWLENQQTILQQRTMYHNEKSIIFCDSQQQTTATVIFTEAIAESNDWRNLLLPLDSLSQG